MITAREVHDAAFRRAAAGTPGYDEVAVDDFLDRVIATLTALEEGHPSAADALTSHEVVETDFPERASDVDGGYDMDDVDDLLDRVAQHLFSFEKSDDARNVQTGELPPAGELSDDDLGAAHAGVAGARVAGSNSDDGGVADAAALATASGAPGRGERDVDPSGSDATGVNPVGADPVDESAAATQDASSAPTQRTQDVHPVGGDLESHDATSQGSQAAGADVPVVHEPLSEETIISYPATDHRVPLPSHDMRGSFSDDDHEAAAQYHPEFSAYAPPEAPLEPAGSEIPPAEPAPSGPAASEAADERPTSSGEARGDAAGVVKTGDTASAETSPWDAPMSSTDAAASSTGDDFDPFAQPVEKATPSAAPSEPAPHVEALRRVAPANEETALVRKAHDDRNAAGVPNPVAAELARRAEERERAAAAETAESAMTSDAVQATPATESDPVQASPVTDADAPTATSDAPQPAGTATPQPAETSAPQVAETTDEQPTETASKTDAEGTSSVTRPEPIEAPEPIDAMERPATIETPKPLPPRKDTSRKGILRRIFRG